MIKYNESMFFFRSSLSNERKQEIADFYSTLNEEQRSFVSDIVADAVNEAEFDFEDN